MCMKSLPAQKFTEKHDPSPFGLGQFRFGRSRSGISWYGFMFIHSKLQDTLPQAVPTYLWHSVCHKGNKTREIIMDFRRNMNGSISIYTGSV